MTLVIKNCVINEEAGDLEPIIEIQGREGGILLWFLTLLKITPTTYFKIYSNKIIISHSSFDGHTHSVMPMHKITQCYLAYSKPWKIALALCFAFVKFYGIGILIGLAYYYINKELQMVFIDKAGRKEVLAFKRSLIEGKSFAEDEAYEMYQAIEELLMDNHSQSSSSVIVTP